MDELRLGVGGSSAFDIDKPLAIQAVSLRGTNGPNKCWGGINPTSAGAIEVTDDTCWYPRSQQRMS
jgi:hypothetical protein